MCLDYMVIWGGLQIQPKHCAARVWTAMTLAPGIHTERRSGDFLEAKIVRFIKNDLKKHLSPSRRRALCPFFVQMDSGMKMVCPSKPAAGSGGSFTIAQSVRLCKKVQWVCAYLTGQEGSGHADEVPGLRGL